MDVENLLEKLGLSKYQTKVLISIMKCGEAKASEISELSGVPRAKIYEVLDQLVDMGLVDKVPSRPVRFRARKPEEVLGRLKQNIISEYETRIKFLKQAERDLLSVLSSIYSTNPLKPKELIRIVSVGDASEKETRFMYSQAKKEIDIISRSFEYFPKVSKELIEATERGVKVRVLLLGRDFLTERSLRVQEKVVEILKSIKNVEIRFSKTILPLRGSIVDPSYEYKTGKAIFVVEDPETPLYLRDAAVTENPSLVAGMKKYFDLIWAYESTEE